MFGIPHVYVTYCSLDSGSVSMVILAECSTPSCWAASSAAFLAISSATRAASSRRSCCSLYNSEVSDRGTKPWCCPRTLCEGSVTCLPCGLELGLQPPSSCCQWVESFDPPVSTVYLLPATNQERQVTLQFEYLFIYLVTGSPLADAFLVSRERTKSNTYKTCRT